MSKEKTSSITKEDLEARLVELEKERDQLRTNIIAFEGAIQDTQFWLKKFNDG